MKTLSNGSCDKSIENLFEAFPKCRNLPETYLSILENGGGDFDNKYYYFYGLSRDTKFDVISWNKMEAWKKFERLEKEAFIFGEDVFGNQLYFPNPGKRKAVKMLWINDGSTMLMANSIDSLCSDLLEGCYKDEEPQYRIYLDFCSNQAIQRDQHVACIKPTLLGGYMDDLSNLHAIDKEANLNLQAQIVYQVKRIPVGTRIKDLEIDYDEQTVRLIW